MLRKDHILPKKYNFVRPSRLIKSKGQSGQSMTDAYQKTKI